MSLAFLRSDHIFPAFEQLLENTALSVLVQFEMLAEYWQDYWLPKVEIWSVYGLERRTNNHVEGWNHGFSRRFEWPHSNFWNFLSALVEEQVFLVIRRTTSSTGVS